MSCEFNLDQLVQATSGKVLFAKDQEFKGFGTDTRKDLSGQIFIALKGENHDAHDYLGKAVESGASVLVIHKESESLNEFKDKTTVVLVEDTLKALQDMAHFWRKNIKAKVVAISGSNGKTTTKEFAKSILSASYKVTASPASFNNHWGVPMSLLSVDKEDDVAIIEMGMNQSGEITNLCKIAEPDIVIVTVVGRSHIGFLGSQEAVADAKEELYLTSPRAMQIFNIDNGFCLQMFERASEKILTHQIRTFSAYRDNADVCLRVANMDLESVTILGKIGTVEGSAKIQVFGRQNGVNVMAASSIALAVGMHPEQIWQELPKVKTSWGRNQSVKVKSGAKVLFDAYNANPESMAALIKNLYEIPVDGRKVVVLGEMLELGDDTAHAHESLGEMVGMTDVDTIWFVGPSQEAFEVGLKRSGFKKTYYLSSTYEQGLAIKIGSMLSEQDVVVIKGSRGVKLEQVLQVWEPENF